jgi:hypothetical protein
MVISRRWAVFLIGVGAWTWLIWPRFAVAIVQDSRSYAGGSPTAFLWVHAALILASLAIGTAVGILGIRAWRAAPRPGGGPVPPVRGRGAGPGADDGPAANLPAAGAPRHEN